MGSYHSNYHSDRKKKKKKREGAVQIPQATWLTTKEFPFKAKINYAENIFYYKNFKLEWYSQRLTSRI